MKIPVMAVWTQEHQETMALLDGYKMEEVKNEKGEYTGRDYSRPGEMRRVADDAVCIGLYGKDVAELTTLAFKAIIAEIEKNKELKDKEEMIMAICMLTMETMERIRTCVGDKLKASRGMCKGKKVGKK